MLAFGPVSRLFSGADFFSLVGNRERLHCSVTDKVVEIEIFRDMDFLHCSARGYDEIAACVAETTRDWILDISK